MSGPEFDRWAIAANNHLFAYVLRKMGMKRCFDPYETRILVRHKNRWAHTMRTSATATGVPIEEQKETWKECIRLAEAEISRAA